MRDRVVQVGPAGRAGAAGPAAGAGPRADQALQGGAGPVPVLGVAVVAGDGGDRLGGDLDGPPAAGGGGGAAVGAGGQRGAVGRGEGDLPPGGAVPGEGAGEQAGGGRRRRAGGRRPAGGGAGGERRGQGHGECGL